jgi:predicted nucleic acid-binding protein
MKSYLTFSCQLYINAVSMKKLRIYLDNCCFNRPYDDQTYETVRLESEAKLFIQDCIRGGKIEAAWSFMLEFENAANPYEEQREAISEWRKLSLEFIAADESIRIRAKELERDYGIKPKDALHLACAIAGKCDFFITTDRIFHKKTLYLKEISILNPVDFVIIVEEK